MERTIFHYILRYSRKQQIVLVVTTLASFPFLYYSLDLPKQIVNKAIGSTEFPRDFFGWEIGQLPYLYILCGLFLLLVLVNGAFKYFLNVYSGQMGERMLRRLRYDLFARILRFPLPHFRRVSQGELISMITGEVEPLGGYIGDSVALPIFQGGTLLTILIFMFVQDPYLGTAAIALYPIQMYLIPKLQRRVNQLGKQRVQAVRKVSERIGEVVSGIQDVHANDTAEYELADFSRRMGGIYKIRFDIYRKKFFIKFLNNFIAQLTPFFFYAIGGYLVITDRLTFGALVAALAAYKDLSAPWKELLNYYQLMEDARIKYDQLVEQFHPPGMLEEELQRSHPDTVPRLAGTVVATNLMLEEEGGIKILDGVSFRFDHTAHVAVIGASGSGRAGLVRVLVRLIRPTAGTLRVGEHNLATVSEAIAGRRLAYIDQTAHLFSGTVRDNLLYGLKHRVVRPAAYEGETEAEYRRFIEEAEQAGNTTSDLGADWIDYEAAGVEGRDGLRLRTVEVLDMSDLKDDVYAMGLMGTIDPGRRADLAASILEARGRLRERLRQPDFARLIEPFDPEAYNVNMSVAENLLFGTPIGAEFDLEHLGMNPYMRQILAKVGLDETFLATGIRIASIMVELFQDLPADHEYFERYSFISAEELPDFQQLVRRVEAGGAATLTDAERSLLLSLPFKLVAGRHRLGVIDEGIRSQILRARKLFAAELPDNLRGAVAFFDAQAYNAAATIQDNILFGKVVYGRREAGQQIADLIRGVIRELDLENELIEVGLETQVGISGGRLSTSQAQKVAIARAVLKRPDILVLNDATAALDPASQASIAQGLFAEFKGRGIVWVVSRMENVRQFDHAVVMLGGKVEEYGKIEDLDQPGRALHGLLNGNGRTVG